MNYIATKSHGEFKLLGFAGILVKKQVQEQFIMIMLQHQLFGGFVVVDGYQIGTNVELSNEEMLGKYLDCWSFSPPK